MSTAAEVAGGKAAVLMIHGLGGTQFDLGSMHKVLQRAGFTTHSLTLPGHGTQPEDLVNVRAEDWIEAVSKLYDDLDALWNTRAERLNQRLREEGLPVQVANLSSIWTIGYTRPSRYNWMLQYYLRAGGLALSWVGTGRLIFSLNYTQADYEAVADRFVAACKDPVGSAARAGSAPAPRKIPDESMTVRMRMRIGIRGHCNMAQTCACVDGANKGKTPH